MPTAACLNSRRSLRPHPGLSSCGNAAARRLRPSTKPDGPGGTPLALRAGAPGDGPGNSPAGGFLVGPGLAGEARFDRKIGSFGRTSGIQRGRSYRRRAGLRHPAPDERRIVVGGKVGGHRGEPGVQRRFLADRVGRRGVAGKRHRLAAAAAEVDLAPLAAAAGLLHPVGAAERLERRPVGQIAASGRSRTVSKRSQGIVSAAWQGSTRPSGLTLMPVEPQPPMQGFGKRA